MPGMKMGTLLALLAVGGLLAAGRAGALPLPAASAIAVTVRSADVLQDAAYVCRRVWRCSNGCGLRRSCYWTPAPFAQVYPYAYRSYWGWRGYPRYWARPHWRGRYWRDRR